MMHADSSWILSENGCDRATSYHMSNKIVRHRDGLFVTWLDDQYHNIIARIDPASGKILEQVAISEGQDNHCGAALATTSDGKLHAMCGAHGAGGFVYRHSGNPTDTDAWSLPASVGAAATYPSFVVRPDDALVVAHRRTGYDDHWGVNLQIRQKQDLRWSWPIRAMRAPAPGYIFPGNHLSVDEDGRMHLLIEFAKTYPDDAESYKILGVTHVYSEDGGINWWRDDGRQIMIKPFGMEDCSFVDHDAAGNIRTGNLVKLPDGRLALSIVNMRTGQMSLKLFEEGVWRSIPLNDSVLAGRPDEHIVSYGGLTLDHRGQLVIVTGIGEEASWSDPRQTICCLWFDPQSEKVVRRYILPKEDPVCAKWLASVEMGYSRVPESPPYMLFTDGNSEKGCINDARCGVRLMQLGEDLGN